ncbi:MAG: cellulase family glycosylhydrolase [Acidimicrobiales bacterium]
MHRLVVRAVMSAAALMVVVSPAGAKPATALPWLTVAHPSGQRPNLVDPQGRTVILHGVNVVGIEDDFYTTPSGKEPGPAPMFPIDPAAYVGVCPAMSHHAGEAPVCEVDAEKPEYDQSSAQNAHNDFAQMRALGFNFVRLGLSWSQLEPTPGVYSARYIRRVAQVVRWAQEQGIYVLLDMHQDAYSRFTPESAPINTPVVGPSHESSAHADGAPSWAVLADGLPAEAALGTPEFNLYVEQAFTSFWIDRVPNVAQGAAPGPGLQDHYIGAMAALARRFKDDSTVVGYEIMNEPLPGSIPPVVFSALELYPFYTRVVDALTGAHDGAYKDLGVGVTKQSFFFEPMAARNTEDAPDQLAAPFTAYPNLVYSPHTYTHVFTADALAGIRHSPYPLSYDQAYEVADAEARSLHAALVVGEYGNGAGDDNTILRAETAAQDAARSGSAIYAWKGGCSAGSTVAQCNTAWSVYAGDPATPPAQNAALIPSRVKFLARPYPRATVGDLQSYRYDPDAKRFTMAAVAGGHPHDDSVVFIPAAVLGNVTVSGAARLVRVDREPDGTRLAFVAPDGGGEYGVTVSGP